MNKIYLIALLLSFLIIAGNDCDMEIGVCEVRIDLIRVTQHMDDETVILSHEVIYDMCGSIR